MKFFAILLLVTACSANPVWNHNHHQHVPVIHNGVPVDTLEVQHAKAAHAAAHAAASHGHVYAAHHGYAEHDVSFANHYSHYDQHVPIIHNGVPVDTPEVQHAKAAHAAASHGHIYAAHHGYAGNAISYAHQHAHYGQHIPVIHNGVPVDTPEVQHAKAAHFAAIARVSHENHGHYAGHYDGQYQHDQHDDGQYRPNHHHEGQYHYEGHQDGQYNPHHNYEGQYYGEEQYHGKGHY